MSRKGTNYSAEFKSKLVLEVLKKNEKTLAEIASIALGSFIIRYNHDNA